MDKMDRDALDVLRARLSSIILSNIVLALTNVSFIETRSAEGIYELTHFVHDYGHQPRFWLYLSISLTIFGRRVMQFLYNS